MLKKNLASCKSLCRNVVQSKTSSIGHRFFLKDKIFIHIVCYHLLPFLLINLISVLNNVS